MRKFVAFIEQFFTALFRYGRTEQRGILLLIAIAAAVLSYVSLQPPGAADNAYFAEVDRLNDSLRADYLRRTTLRNTPRPASIESRYRPAPAGGKPTVFIELNSADSALLTTVRGIGPVLSRNIVAYRRRLGGFVRKNQLKEVRGIDDENFDAISAQFFLDTAVIQKINLNFAPANVLRSHPYFTESMVERMVRGRERIQETEGGWSTLRELTDKDILLPDEARRVAPYVVFETR